MDFSKIKLIIWDLDDTLWQGTLSEGEVVLKDDRIALIKALTDLGIVNSISSKNEAASVNEKLKEAGLLEFFVFNHINWESKGPQIREKISSMRLRPENVLFIDDSLRNIEEVKTYCEGILTADPSIIEELLAFTNAQTPTDSSHERLTQYQILEQKTKACSNYSSNEQFLMDIHIEISIGRDCLSHIDRIADLVGRSNQLNYTKKRDSKEVLHRLLSDDWNDAGYIRMRDQFGDYGIVGFFCYNRREEKMEHFLFSCRTMGIRLEQYIYNFLGCPSFPIAEPVAASLSPSEEIPWIQVVPLETFVEVKEQNNSVRILLKGPCDLDAVAPYLIGGNITTEFNYVSPSGVIVAGQNHSTHLWERAHLSDETIREILSKVPFLDKGDFQTLLFQNPYHIVCYSLLPDCHAGLYRHKETGHVISFGSVNFPLTDSTNWEGYCNGSLPGHAFPFTREILESFSQEWEFIGTTTPEELIQNLTYMAEHIKGLKKFILILGSEVPCTIPNAEFADHHSRHKEINKRITEFADLYNTLHGPIFKLLNLTDFIKTPEDYSDCINHFSKRVYYDLATAIVSSINDSIAQPEHYGPSFDTLIVIKPDDFNRQKRNYKRLVKNLPSKRLLFVSSDPIGDYIKEAELAENVSFIDESTLLPFEKVHQVMQEHLSEILHGLACPRAYTGWYYQQFLKMQYALTCQDEYYMVWDGDTIPCKSIEMFSRTGVPYFDMKHEYHAPYFETLEKLLPGMRKCLKKSFISEHMMFQTAMMRALIHKIESNDSIEGTTFWEKIIHAIPPQKMGDSAFSEFETYGTFVCLTDPSLYKAREWHSFRLGAEFFDPNTITDRDYTWLAKDFHAISFEKDQTVREDHQNLFNNPSYQEKLSARQMLEIAQEEFKGGYIEIWDDQSEKAAPMDPLNSQSDSSLQEPEDQILYQMGNDLLTRNSNQAYLCYEQAAFLTNNQDLKRDCYDKMQNLQASGTLQVSKTSFAIVSYNKKELLEQCIFSIREHCAPGSYEIVVVDNASTDGVREWLSADSDDMTVLLSDKNLGFSAGCNVCIKYASKGNDVFLLNNDTRITHNALFWLRMGLYAAEEIGATGCMANECGSIEQKISLPFDDPNRVVAYAREQNIPLANPYEEKSRLCGFAMLLKHTVLSKISGLDEAFGLGYFEDDDLSLQIRQAGYKLFICHNSFIYHKGSASFSSHPAVEELIRKNYTYIREKWGYDCFASALVTQNEWEILNHLTGENKRLLEIDCGAGNFLSRIKFLHPTYDVVGIDQEQKAIDQGLASLHLYSINFQTEDLPFAEYSFDYIIVKERICNYNPELLVQKLKKYVVPGGELLLVRMEDY